WYRECSSRRVRAGDLIGIDTDMVGPFGYNADMSRTFFCGPGRPSGHQRTLYSLAHEQVRSNIALLRPGLAHGVCRNRTRRWQPAPSSMASACTMNTHKSYRATISRPPDMTDTFRKA